MGMGTGSASQISSAGIMGNRGIRVIPSGAPRDVAKPRRPFTSSCSRDRGYVASEAAVKGSAPQHNNLSGGFINSNYRVNNIYVMRH